MERFTIAIGALFFNFKKILQVAATYLQAPTIYFQDFQKVVKYIPQLLRDKEGVVEYIPQLFENNAGVVEYISQLLHYSITCPLKVGGKVIKKNNNGNY